jgi:recombination protein RecA
VAKESDQVISGLHKEMGERVGGKNFKIPEIERVPIGIFPLDFAIGGGIPVNRVSIIYGPESSTKTSLLLKIIAAFQKRKQTVALIETEYSLEPKWVEQMGVSMKDLVLFRPTTAEQAVDMVQAILHADDVGLVCLDSVGSLVTAHEIESESGKRTVAGASMLTTELMKKIVSAFNTESQRGHFPTVVLVNQIRSRIGAMYQDPEIMPGGNLLRFAASLTIRLYAKDKMVKEISDKVPAYKEVKGAIRKHKIPIASKSFEYDMCIVNKNGLKVGDVDAWPTVVAYLKQTGLMAKQEKGGWTCLGKKFSTIEQVKELYDTDPASQLAINEKLFESAALLPPEEA